MTYLSPPLASVGTYALVAAQSPNWSNTINLGAVIVAAMVLAVGGLFTIRSNVSRTWHEAYEAEKVRAELAEADAKRQHIEKHELKTELAAAMMKTDLTDHQLTMLTSNKALAEGLSTVLIERLALSEENILQGFKAQNAVLVRIADRLDHSAAIRDQGDSLMMGDAQPLMGDGEPEGPRGTK